MADGKRDRPTDRQVSQRQAGANAQAARDTRKSQRPGVDDDSEIVRALAGTLAAPVEGALDSMREGERDAGHGQEPAPDPVGGVTGQRAGGVPPREADRRGKVPTRPEDAEAEPSEIAEDMSRDRPGAMRGR